jgi:AraC-like DNA-binding protein
MFAHMPILRDILYGAAQRGANLQAMCRKLGVSVEDLNRSDRVAEFKTAYSAWSVALEATGDAMLGLRLGMTTTPSILGIVGHMMQNCATLSEAFRQVCDYSAVATDMFKYSMSERADQTTLMFSPSPAWTRVSPQTARQAVDQAMAGCLNVFFLLSGRHVPPISASFAFRRPTQPELYTQVFGPVLRFDAKTHTLVFARNDLQQPLHQYDRSLFSTFEGLAKKQLRMRRSKRTFKEDVLHRMRFEFAAQVPSLKIMAAHMNLSTRTFQRKLTAEGIQFRELADLVSKEIAITLMGADNMSISDVARLMGYSDPRAFRRAVKRWTKSTPGKLKRSHKRSLPKT